MPSSAAVGPGWIDRLLPALSLLALALLWWAAGTWTRFIAGPGEVFAELPHFVSQSETWVHIWLTLRRVAIGLFGGVAFGVVTALLMSQSPPAKNILGVYVALALRTPSTIAAIVAVAMFQRSELGYIAVVSVITFPFVAIGLLDGLEDADDKLDDLAQIYRVSSASRLRNVLLPYIAPYIFSSLRNAHALAWKVIVVAEIFGAAARGFGGRFNHAFDHFLLVELMLWLLVFVAFVLLADYGVLRSIERRVFRWRSGED